MRELIVLGTASFSQRYPEAIRFWDEARKEFDGEIVIAEDLMRVAVPARLPSKE